MKSHCLRAFTRALNIDRKVCALMHSIKCIVLEKKTMLYNSSEISNQGLYKKTSKQSVTTDMTLRSLEMAWSCAQAGSEELL